METGRDQRRKRRYPARGSATWLIGRLAAPRIRGAVITHLGSMEFLMRAERGIHRQRHPCVVGRCQGPPGSLAFLLKSKRRFKVDTRSCSSKDLLLYLQSPPPGRNRKNGEGTFYARSHTKVYAVRAQRLTYTLGTG